MPTPAPRPSLTREDVLAAAGRLVRDQGPQALTMRRLAAELGTAVTSIYWHVGNRESLLDALVTRAIREMGEIRPSGRTPAARIVSVARALRRGLLDRPQLVAMVHERGPVERLFRPAQQALVREVRAAGLRGVRAAHAVRALQFHVTGHVLAERAGGPGPVPHPAECDPWDARSAADGDPALARALTRPTDPERLFLTSVRALVDGLLG